MAETDRPDHGRAWVIAFAAFVINMILSGLSRMTGVLYVAVINEFQVSREEATFPFSLRKSVRNLSGPIAGLIGHHLGISGTTFCGGVIAVLGAGLCYIAPNFYYIIVFWGVIHGFGVSLANTLFQVVLNQYFEKYRVTALGIALSGACLGSFAFPYFFEMIIDNYGLRGSFLMIAGIILHVLPAAIFLKPPSWIKKAKNKRRESFDASKEPSDESVITPQEEEELRKRRSYRILSFSDSPMEDMELINARRTSDCPSEKEYNTDKTRNGSICHTQRSFSSTQVKIPAHLTMREINKNNANSSNSTNQNDKLQVYVISNSSSVMDKAALSNAQSAEKGFFKTTEITSSIVSSVLNVIKLYKSPLYLLMSFLNAAFILISVPLTTVVVDYGKDKGLQEYEGKYLLNAIAFGDLMGRLSFGWVTDKGYLQVQNFMSLCMGLQGVIIFVFPLAYSLPTFLGFLFVYGTLAGTELVLLPSLVLRYIPQEQQALAITCVGFLSGIVTFGIPGLIGYFRDHLGSYDGLFYLGAALSLMSCVLWLLEPFAAKIHLRNQDISKLKSVSRTDLL